MTNHPTRKPTTDSSNRGLARQGPSTALGPGTARDVAPTGYAEWLADVKVRIHAAQQRATLAVNRELLGLYWQLGRDILERQQRHGWGAGIVDKVATDFRTAFPAMKGFSRANLMYMRAFAEAWPEADFVQQPVGQLPWGHSLVLLTKLKDRDARLAYAAAALEHGRSRAVLVHHVEARKDAGALLPTCTGIERSARGRSWLACSVDTTGRMPRRRQVATVERGILMPWDRPGAAAHNLFAKPMVVDAPSWCC